MTKPTDTKSAAWRIFNEPFQYSIAAIHHYHPDYLNVVGIPSTGNPKEDRGMMQDKIHTAAPIRKLVQLWSENVPFQITHRVDCATIYDILHEHLSDWETLIATDPNIKDAPLEQLREMSDFADALYPLAQAFRPNTPRKLSFAERMGRMGGPLERSEPVRGAQVAQPTKPARRTSILSRMETMLDQRRR